MSTAVLPLTAFGRPEALERRFLEALPRIEAHARCAFRDLACTHRRADAIAETIALSWSWFVRLASRGKDATRFISRLASFAARAVRSGRRLAGQERPRDVLSPNAQARQGFTVRRLLDVSTLKGNVWDDALRDNTQSPVPDQVCFRLDFPRWRRRQTQRNRRVIDALAVGERAWAVARQTRLTPARISQLRRRFHDDWQQFCGDAPKTEALAQAALTPR